MSTINPNVAALRDWARENNEPHARKGILTISGSGTSLKINYIPREKNVLQYTWTRIKGFFDGSTHLNKIVEGLRGNTELLNIKIKSESSEIEIKDVLDSKINCFNDKFIHKLFGKIPNLDIAISGVFTKTHDQPTQQSTETTKTPAKQEEPTLPNIFNPKQLTDLSKLLEGTGASLNPSDVTNETTLKGGYRFGLVMIKIQLPPQKPDEPPVIAFLRAAPNNPTNLNVTQFFKDLQAYKSGESSTKPELKEEKLTTGSSRPQEKLSVVKGTQAIEIMSNFLKVASIDPESKTPTVDALNQISKLPSEKRPKMSPDQLKTVCTYLKDKVNVTLPQHTLNKLTKSGNIDILEFVFDVNKNILNTQKDKLDDPLDRIMNNLQVSNEPRKDKSDTESSVQKKEESKLQSKETFSKIYPSLTTQLDKNDLQLFGKLLSNIGIVFNTYAMKQEIKNGFCSISSLLDKIEIPNKVENESPRITFLRELKNDPNRDIVPLDQLFKNISSTELPSKELKFISDFIKNTAAERTKNQTPIEKWTPLFNNLQQQFTKTFSTSKTTSGALEDAAINEYVLNGVRAFSIYTGSKLHHDNRELKNFQAQLVQAVRADFPNQKAKELIQEVDADVGVKLHKAIDILNNEK